jgi:hypothetical protein
MRGNIVNIDDSILANPRLYLVSEYSTHKWAPDADHWIHTARHEAGHAVALVCMSRKFSRDYDSFERILIRPGATESYVTRRGRRSDCLGCVEHAASVPLSLRNGDRIHNLEKRRERSMAATLEIKIVANLAGPLAEMCSWNERAELHSKEYDWAWEDNKEEIRCVGGHVDDLRAIVGSGTMESYERQSYDLVKREWPAIAALADELMLRHVLEYNEALAVIEPWLTPASTIARPARNASSRGKPILA